MKSKVLSLLVLQLLTLFTAGCGFAQGISPKSASQSTLASKGDLITIRTETYPRPPYSSATYYIYEKHHKAICTKLKVCDKFDSCESNYVVGSFTAPEDVSTGKPYRQTAPVPVENKKLSKHMCLTKFSLLDK